MFVQEVYLQDRVGTGAGWSSRGLLRRKSGKVLTKGGGGRDVEYSFLCASYLRTPPTHGCPDLCTARMRDGRARTCARLSIPSTTTKRGTISESRSFLAAKNLLTRLASVLGGPSRSFQRFVEKVRLREALISALAWLTATKHRGSHREMDTRRRVKRDARKGQAVVFCPRKFAKRSESWRKWFCWMAKWST